MKVEIHSDEHKIVPRIPEMSNSELKTTTEAIHTTLRAFRLILDGKMLRDGLPLPEQDKPMLSSLIEAQERIKIALLKECTGRGLLAQPN